MAFCKPVLGKHKHIFVDLSKPENRHPELGYSASKGHPTTIRKIIIEYGYIANRCAICNCGDNHNGRPLTLQLDHENGNRSDNSPENLRFLCPNCHSQQKTSMVNKNKYTDLPRWSEITWDEKVQMYKNLILNHPKQASIRQTLRALGMNERSSARGTEFKRKLILLGLPISPNPEQNTHKLSDEGKTLLKKWVEGGGRGAKTKLDSDHTFF